MTHDPFVALSAPPPIWAVQSNGHSADPEPESIIPCNIEAERAVLGSILLDSEALFVAAKILKPGDFFREPHQWLYQIMLDLSEANKAIDFVTIIDALEKKKLLSEVGGPAFVTGLISTTASSMYAEHYAQIVYEDAVRRRMIAASGKIAELAYDRSVDLPALLSKADREVADLGKNDQGSAVSLGEAISSVVSRIDYMANNPGMLLGIPTGFSGLDRMLNGLQRSDFVIVAGRPGMGKSTFAINIGMNAAKRYNCQVAIFSLEMSTEQLTFKMLSSETGVDVNRLRRGDVNEDEWQVIMEASNLMAKTPLIIDDSPGMTMSYIRGKARQLMREQGLDLIVIDYLQLATDGSAADRSGNREQEVSRISRSLKALARELNIPVIALSQLSRSVESRSDKRPMLSDLRECVVGDTLLTDSSTGKQVKIKDAKPGMMILGMSGNQKILPYRVNDVWSTGVKKVYTLTTRTGRSVTASGNHPFLTADGWKRLDELQDSDVIATSTYAPIMQDMPERADLCRLLGYMAGNGSYQKHRCLAYCSSDQDSLEDLLGIVKNRFPAVAWRERERTEKYADGYFSSVFENGYGKPSGNPMINWFKEIMALGHKDSDKCVPDFVFEAGYTGAKEFVSGYLATDGCVKKHGVRWSIHFDTTSLQLARDVQSLLLRLNVVATIGNGAMNTKSTKPIYRLQVLQYAQNMLAFVNQVEVRGRKGRLLKQIPAELPTEIYGASAFGLPKFVSKIMEYTTKVAGLPTDQLWRDQGKSPNRMSCLRVAKATNNPVLDMWARSDLLWEPIRSIEYAGEEATYDINVECANFVANGIIAHNSGSLEQDADVVLFLYRDDYYNDGSEKPNIADVIIAKHRLGSTGSVSLFFRKEIGQFRDLEIERTELEY